MQSKHVPIPPYTCNVSKQTLPGAERVPDDASGSRCVVRFRGTKQVLERAELTPSNNMTSANGWNTLELIRCGRVSLPVISTYGAAATFNRIARVLKTPQSK